MEAGTQATEVEQVEEVPPADAAAELPSAAVEAPLATVDAAAGDAPDEGLEQDTDEPAALGLDPDQVLSLFGYTAEDERFFGIKAIGADKR